MAEVAVKDAEQSGAVTWVYFRVLRVGQHPINFTTI